MGIWATDDRAGAGALQTQSEWASLELLVASRRRLGRCCCRSPSPISAIGGLLARDGLSMSACCRRGDPIRDWVAFACAVPARSARSALGSVRSALVATGQRYARNLFEWPWCGMILRYSFIHVAPTRMAAAEVMSWTLRDTKWGMRATSRHANPWDGKVEIVARQIRRTASPLSYGYIRETRAPRASVCLVSPPFGACSRHPWHLLMTKRDALNDRRLT